MFFIVWYRSIYIRSSWIFTDESEKHLDWKLKAYNKRYFFTFFFIPLIPLFCSSSLWHHWWDYYSERKMYWYWSLINNIFSVLWIAVVTPISTIIWSVFYAIYLWINFYIQNALNVNDHHGITLSIISIIWWFSFIIISLANKKNSYIYIWWIILWIILIIAWII